MEKGKAAAHNMQRLLWSFFEVTLYCHVKGQTDLPMIFGQLTKRDGSFLVSKKAEPNFKWSDTANKRVLAGRRGGVPAMTLQYVMNQAGVNTDTPLFDTSVAFDAMVATFKTDPSVDYCTMFEPAATDTVKEGKGYIVSAIGRDSGEVPYTAFSARSSYLKENKDIATKFLKCVVRGYKYMLTASTTDVAKALEKSFIGTSLEQIENAIKSYVEIDAWTTTPVMSKASFDKLQEIMENAGELSTRVSFDAAVDNSIALEVI